MHFAIVKIVDGLFYKKSTDEVLKALETQESGLSNEEVARRLKKFGPNELTSKKKVFALSIFISQFKNSLILILIGAAVAILFVYYFSSRETADLIEASLIFSIVIMMTVLGFIQEYKAEKAIESLKKLLAYKTKVRRDGQESEINVKDLVQGDIIILEEGEKVPSDIRLLEVRSLQANESSLTGESTPVEKKVDPLEKDVEIADQNNMVFSGTVISSGRGVGIVVTTGDKTEIGKIAKFIAEAEEKQTHIQKQLDRIGKLIGFIILGICLIVFIFILFIADTFSSLPIFERIIQSFIASVALAVAAIPEGLPAVVTITLALGTQRMAKKNALVRKLNSVETLGSVDVICADKTGTLTKGEMTVKKLYCNNTIFEVSGVGYETKGEFSSNGNKVDENKLNLLLTIGNLCNNSSIDKNGKVLGDPTEAALLISSKKANVINQGKRVFEIPFSSERKLMSVVVEEGGNYYVYTKGAVELLLPHCVKISQDGKVQLMKNSDKNTIQKINEEFSKQALRNLGFAYKILTKDGYEKQQKFQEQLENDLIFVGMQGMIDPPREEVKSLISQCQESGVKTVMITGDHIQTAIAVASEIGIRGEAIMGKEVENLEEEKLREVVDKIGIYARVNPGIKLKIVNAFQKNNHIVAMTGDGVNDAPALKRADIGIAMGINGTDVAKEASDMILLDDKFSTIVDAISEGRSIYHNIRKFVSYLLSCNMAEVLVVFLSIVLFHDVPLTATMLLWINVVTDGFPSIALGLDSSNKAILSLSPKQFKSAIINKQMWIYMIVISIALTIGTISLYVLNLNQGISQARGAIFTALVFFELVTVYIIRSCFNTKLFSNRYLFYSIVLSAILQVLIIYMPFFARLFEVGAIEIYDWIYILVFSALLWIVIKPISKKYIFSIQ